MYRKNKKTLVVMTVLLLIVFCTVGYAYLQRTLVINGDTTVQKNTWDVRFTTITTIRNDGEIITAPTVSNNTNIAFAVKLNKPGDTYIFTAIIENRGSLDAMISGTPVISGLEDMASYLEAHVTYGDGATITDKDLLKKDSKETIRVVINYKRNITEADIAGLSESDVTKVMRLSVSYVQAESANQRIVEHKLCIKADNLHQATCTRTSDGCIGNGYSNGDIITYGHTDSTKLQNGNLVMQSSKGYALTCDVNGDNVYDEETERFYYVSDLMYYDTTNNQVAYDSNYATLIYYTNIKNKIPTTNINSYIGYNSQNNYSGPSSSLMSNMPTNTDWKNTLKRDLDGHDYRQIVSINGLISVTVDGVTYDFAVYDYGSYGARLLTRLEFQYDCGSVVNLDRKCNFLMENTSYDRTGVVGGYWLDTPSDTSIKHIWRINAVERRLYTAGSGSALVGVRPAIEVLKTNISLN